jgi:hypothetical protein
LGRQNCFFHRDHLDFHQLGFRLQQFGIKFDREITLALSKKQPAARPSMTHDGPAAPPRLQLSQSCQDKTKNHCFNFNTKECTRQSCRFDHICVICDQQHAALKTPACNPNGLSSKEFHRGIVAAKRRQA